MKSESAKKWSLLVGKFLAGQGFVQLLNLTAGLLLLRFLSLEQYALYTLANVLFGMAIVASDLGLGQATLALGSRMRDDRSALGRFMATIIYYRRLFFGGAALLVLILTPFLANKHHWVAWEVGGIVLIVLASTWVYLSLSMKTAILNLHHDAVGQIKPGLIAAVFRLVITVLGAVFLPFAIVAMLANLLALLLNSHLVKKEVGRYAVLDAEPEPAYKPEIKRFIYPLVPGAAYYAVQGQVSALLISMFGTVAALAQVGALGRLTQILGLFGMANSFFTLPYFARIANKELFIRRGILLLSGATGLLAIMLLSSYLFPQYWLMILGHTYSNLTQELPLAIAAAMINFISGLLYTLLISRAETGGQQYSVIMTLGIQVAFIIFVGVNTPYDAFVLNLFMAIGSLLVNAALLTRMIARKVEWAPQKNQLAPSSPDPA